MASVQKHIVWIWLLCLTNTVLLAQKTIIQHQGKPHFIHLVQKGETLYGLSKQYQVTVKDIQQANPSLEEKGLVLGLELIIPTYGLKSFSHLVSKGETLYAISKKYQCSIDDLLRLNPELKQTGLKPEQSIQIPTPSLEKTTTERSPMSVPVPIQPEVNIASIQGSRIELKPENIKKIDSMFTAVNPKDTIKMAVLLPFYLNENDSLVATEQKIYYKSELGLDIYSGILASIDTLKKKGFLFELFVYDVESDTNELLKIINEMPLADIDVIVGPLYQNAFQFMCKKALPYHIPVFCPVQNSNKIIHNLPNAYKLVPSLQAQYLKAGDCISHHFSKEKLIIIDHGTKNKEFAKQLMSKFNLLHTADEKFIRDSAVYLSMNKVDLTRIQSVLSPSKKNILLVLSEDLVFVSDFVNKLYNASKNDNIYLFAPESWMSFKNLDVDQLQGLNTHVTSMIDLSFGTTDTSFTDSVWHHFGTFPEKYFLTGYNILFYFLSSSQPPSNSLNYKGIRFVFVRPDQYGGYENNGLYVFRLEQYTYIKVF